MDEDRSQEEHKDGGRKILQSLVAHLGWTACPSWAHEPVGVGREPNWKFWKRIHLKKEPFPGLAKIISPLSACCQNHPPETCGKPDGPRIEITLIDCSSRRLIKTQSSVPYAALSYVWGKDTTPVPLAPGPGMHLADKVLRVIEDAMVVARYLGLPYLWVDQYCVDQQDEEVKARQIDEMHQVYGHADVTIVAAAGEDATDGLAPSSSSGFHRATGWKATWLSEYQSVDDQRSAIASINRSVWNTRGWTYQEAYVSRRVLVFHSDGVYFECADHAPPEWLLTPSKSTIQRMLNDYDRDSVDTASDLLREMLPDMYLRNGPRRHSEATRSIDGIFSSLGALVTAYSTRSLTSQDDALRAFSAVLNDFDGLETSREGVDQARPSSINKLRHVWFVSVVQGLPFEYLVDNWGHSPWEICSANIIPLGLCWRHGRHGHKRRANFPSWSWAGWEGQVDWAVQDEDHLYQRGGSAFGFQLHEVGFRRALGKGLMSLGEASSTPGPLVLHFTSIAFPAAAFYDNRGLPDDDFISFYGHPIPRGPSGQLNPKSYFTHAEGTRQISCRSLQVSLQRGELRIVLLYSLELRNKKKMSFQAWILQKRTSRKGRTFYERVGSMCVEHGTKDQKLKFGEILEGIIESDGLEVFEIC